MQTRHKRPALHGLVIVGVLVAVAVAMTFALTGNIQDNLDSMTGSNRVAITTINAYTAEDRLVISGNIQNLGSQPLTSVTIDEITVGDIVITQTSNIADGEIAPGHGTLTLIGLDDAGTSLSGTDDSDTTGTAGSISSGVAGLTITDTTGGFNIVKGSTDAGTGGTVSATVTITGLSNDENVLESLSAGSSKSFRIVVTGKSSGGSADVLDILRSVPASTQLFMTVSATDGSASTISDPRSVRVTAR